MTQQDKKVDDVGGDAHDAQVMKHKVQDAAKVHRSEVGDDCSDELKCDGVTELQKLKKYLKSIEGETKHRVGQIQWTFSINDMFKQTKSSTIPRSENLGTAD
jgi:hypothetical protein